MPDLDQLRADPTTEHARALALAYNPEVGAPVYGAHDAELLGALRVLFRAQGDGFGEAMMRAQASDNRLIVERVAPQRLYQVTDEELDAFLFLEDAFVFALARAACVDVAEGLRLHRVPGCAREELVEVLGQRPTARRLRNHLLFDRLHSGEPMLVWPVPRILDCANAALNGRAPFQTLYHGIPLV